MSLIAALLTLCLLLFSSGAKAQESAVYDSISALTAGMTPAQIFSLGERLTAGGDNDRAIAAFSQACNMFDRRMSQADKQICVKAHLNLSRLWIAKGNLINALQVMMNALDIAKTIPDNALTLRILNNMGYIYLTFEHYEEAADYFSRAEALNSELNDPNADFLLFNNLASTHAALGNNSKSEKYLDKLRRLNVTDPAIRQSAPYYIGLLDGIILNNKGKYAPGAAKIKDAISYAVRNGLDNRLQCSGYEELYKSYAGKKDNDSTLWALTKYYESARDAGMPEKEVVALREIYRIHEANGDAAKAICYKAAYLELADSVMKFREFARLNSVRVVHESMGYRAEIAALNTDSILKKQRIRLQFGIILGISAALLVIIVLLAVVYNQKRKLRLSYEHLFKIHTSALKEQKEHHQAETGSPRKENKYAGSNLQEETSARLADAIRNIMENTEEPCSPDFSVQKLADLTGSNSKYVSQVINDSFGMNFSTMLNNCRIQKAKERLADVRNYGNQTIQSISMSVGYRNQTSFIAAFKKSVGMTPSVFLKMARQQAAAEE